MVSETGAVLHPIGDSDETIFSNSRMIVGGVRDYRYVSFPLLVFHDPLYPTTFFFFFLTIPQHILVLLGFVIHLSRFML